ncbi:MAG: PQQ-binding-like beta-propeller repeat protein [Planctomycetales bacterium]
MLAITGGRASQVDADGPNLPTLQPEILWKYVSASIQKGDGTKEMIGVTGPVTEGGVVYFADDLGRVFALRSADGGEVWRHDHGKRIAVAPTLDQDQLYFGSAEGVTALHREHGRPMWKTEIPQGADEAAPIAVDGRVFASGYDGRTYALDRRTGMILWTHDFSGDAPDDPPGFVGKQARFQTIAARPGGSACDGQLFYQSVFDQCRVIALDCATGERRWTFQAAGWMSAAPTIVGDRLYVSSQDGHMYCLDRQTGTLIWKFQSPGWFQSRVAVREGTVFMIHHRGRLYLLDDETGMPLNTFQMNDDLARDSLHGGGPLLSGRTVYFSIGNGQVYAVDIASGEVRWKLQPSEHSRTHSQLATDGKRLFLLTSQNLQHEGESAIIAIGDSPETD